jgi:predicted nucleic acid-binding protein
LSAYVTDTNLWIDLHCGGLVPTVLERVDGLCATHFVLRELQRELSGEHLVKGGVRRVELDGPQVAELFALRGEYPALSVEDLSALVAARALGGMLLTGDNHLRKVAEALGVPVHGTRWMLEFLVTEHDLRGAEALIALDAMLADGSRFPTESVAHLKRRLTSE